MYYQGPKYFRESVFSIYERMCPFLSRKDPPRVLVGGIEQILCTSDTPRIIGDRRLNFLIDKAFEACCGMNQEDEELEVANNWRIELYNEAAIIPAETSAVYYPMLDLLVLHPEPILSYMSACCIPINHVVETQNELYIQQVISSLHYPYFLAGHFVFWDFGDTRLHRDIQHYSRRLHLSFDKTTDGKFSHETFFAQSSLRQFAHQDKLVEIFEKMIDLQITDLIADASLLIAMKAMIPLPELAEYQAVFPPLEGINERLITRAEKDPKEFLLYIKSKVDYAYALNKSVFSLLETD